MKISENILLALFQGFVGEDVPSDANGQNEEQNFKPDLLADRYGTIG